MDTAEVLHEVAEQVKRCVRCDLHFSRKNAVPGEGPANAEIMLIGEAPGFYENEQGRPFVGSSGKFLGELLQKGGITREEVFITNIVKCRPPANRDPLPEELATCNDYLETQMNALNPLVIVTLGRFSLARFIPNVRISDVHGKPRWIKEQLIIPMYHPAAALHQPALRSVLERDFSHLMEWVKQARQKRGGPASSTSHPTGAGPAPEKREENPPAQPSLF
ncbi:MAG: uracil-DNA glycosylase [Anaerolineaceae bacterium]|nr:uracil-DNA glycosylase [Anaerolineaceae bacterium]